MRFKVICECGFEAWLTYENIPPACPDCGTKYITVEEY